jgi:hypothetical protein
LIELSLISALLGSDFCLSNTKSADDLGLDSANLVVVDLSCCKLLPGGVETVVTGWLLFDLFASPMHKKSSIDTFLCCTKLAADFESTDAAFWWLSWVLSAFCDEAFAESFDETPPLAE